MRVDAASFSRPIQRPDPAQMSECASSDRGPDSAQVIERRISIRGGRTPKWADTDRPIGRPRSLQVIERRTDHQTRPSSRWADGSPRRRWSRISHVGPRPPPMDVGEAAPRPTRPRPGIDLRVPPAMRLRSRSTLRARRGSPLRRRRLDREARSNRAIAGGDDPGQDHAVRFLSLRSVMRCGGGHGLGSSPESPSRRWSSRASRTRPIGPTTRGRTHIGTGERTPTPSVRPDLAPSVRRTASRRDGVVPLSWQIAPRPCAGGS